MYGKYFKRIFDLILAIVALPFWFIILLIIGPIIYIQDKGPIFYNAPRLGKDGRIFKMYKFRSMKVNAPDIRNEDGSTFNSEDDPRLTKIGKFIRKTSLDETPQLLNIIKGDMSIIGPRPSLPDAFKKYDSNSKRKFEVRPGITGYSQAYFRNSIGLNDKVQKDIYYIEHISWLLDIRIFIKTAINVFRKENIYGSSGTEVNKKAEEASL